MDAPPIAPTTTYRRATVTNLAVTISRYTWTALYGGAGVGRTQLLALLAQAHPHRYVWVRLYGFSTADACQAIDATCSAITGQPPSPYRQAWYNRVCQALGRGTLIILDDLPRLDNGDELAGRLTILERAAAVHGVHLVTMGTHPVPRGMIGQFKRKALRELPVPLFSDEEASNIMRAAGAPEAFLSPHIIEGINAAAERHPMVLTTIAHKLKQRRWHFTERDMPTLLGGDDAARLTNETLPRFIATVDDDDSRELLARLCLIGGPFSDDAAHALAAITPVITRPAERLARLQGLWLQRDSAERLVVSSLIRALNDDLSRETRRACYHTLGQRIISKKKLDQVDAMAGIAYFTQAEEPNLAAMLLASTLVDLMRGNPALPNMGLLDCWTNALPAGLNPDMALYLRSVQIAARAHRSLPTETLVADLEARIAASGDDAGWGIITAAVYAPTHKNRYLAAALKHAPNVRLPDGSPLVIPDGVRLEYLLWMHVDTIETETDLHAWMDVVMGLTPEQRTRAFQGPVAEMGCLHVAEALRQQEKKRVPRERHWPLVMTALDDLVSRARSFDLELLWACAVRVKIAIHAEYLDDLDAARTLTEEALAQASPDARVHFLLCECLGQEYLRLRRDAEALVWFDLAVAWDTQAFPYRRFLALLGASRASVDDPARAVHYAEDAVQVVRAHDEIPEPEMVRALGELAIARWHVDGIAAAFEPWAEAGDRLLNCKEQTERWEDLFVTYGHASGYLAALARGTPTERTPDGEDYTAPWPGMFVGPLVPGRAARYDETQDCFLLTQLAMYAQAVGDDTRAAAWIEQGLNLARSADQKLALLTLGMDLIPDLVVADRFGAALDAAREVVPLGVAIWNRRGDGGNLWRDVDVAAILGPPSSEGWRDAEYHAASLSLIPIAFRLAALIQSDPDHGRRLAREVANLCHEIAIESADADLWNGAGDIFVDVYAGAQSHPSCIARTPTDNPVLHVLGYLGATLQQDTVPLWALRAQLILIVRANLERVRRLAPTIAPGL